MVIKPFEVVEAYTYIWVCMLISKSVKVNGKFPIYLH